MGCFGFPKEKSGDEHSVLLGWNAHKGSAAPWAQSGLVSSSTAPRRLLCQQPRPWETFQGHDFPPSTVRLSVLCALQVRTP